MSQNNASQSKIKQQSSAVTEQVQIIVSKNKKPSTNTDSVELKSGFPNAPGTSDNSSLTKLPVRRTLSNASVIRSAGISGEEPKDLNANISGSSTQLCTPEQQDLNLLATIAGHHDATVLFKSPSTDSVVTVGSFPRRRPDATFAKYCTHSKILSDQTEEEREVVDLISISNSSRCSASSSDSEMSTQTLEEEEEPAEKNSSAVSNGNAKVGTLPAVLELGNSDVHFFRASSSGTSNSTSMTTTTTAASPAMQSAQPTESSTNTSTTNRYTLPTNCSSTATAITNNTLTTSTTDYHKRKLDPSRVLFGSELSEDSVSLKLPRLSQEPQEMGTGTTNTTSSFGAHAINDINTANATASDTNTNNTITADTSTYNNNSATDTPDKTNSTTHNTTGVDTEAKRAADIAHLERIFGNREVRGQLSAEQLVALLQ